MNKLFILDAMALAHRAYWVHSELANSEGRLTGVVYGAATFITNLIASQQPTHFIVVTDTGKPTFRHEMYSEYKANRGEKKEGLISQLPDYYKLFEHMKIPVISQEGYEADDVIGSVAKQFAREDLPVFIVSADKDFYQIIDRNIYMFKPGKWPNAELIDPMGVYKKIGVMPDQVIDYLAIVGDTADNVPGVKGIGGKGAADLLKSFGTLENIYQNLSLIKGKKKIDGLTNHHKEAVLSKDLVTIRTDLTIDVNLDDMRLDVDAATNQDVLNYYKELEFKSFLG